jgi:hypothetical protein
MNRSLQYDLLVSRNCGCGGLIVYDGKRYICERCFRIICPECKAAAIVRGRYFRCPVCNRKIK